MTDENHYPFDIVDVEPETAKLYMEKLTGELTGFIRVGPKRYMFPYLYRHIASSIYNMPLRQDDIFVASFPRSGTTWTQELVWMVLNDFDYATAKTIPLTKRYKFLEYTMLSNPILEKHLMSENRDSKEKLDLLAYICQPGTKHLAQITTQRFIKTHLPISLLPTTLFDTAKMVYVARDPRDVVVSSYHLHCLLKRLAQYLYSWNFFINDLHYYAPYFEHLKEAWEMRHHPNLLFLFYEDMSKDLPATIRRVATFLNKTLTDEQIAKLCDHLSFENFKYNKSVNLDELKQIGLLNGNSHESLFVRKGKVGGWRDYFDEEMTREADNWMAKNLKDTDLRFPH